MYVPIFDASKWWPFWAKTYFSANLVIFFVLVVFGEEKVDVCCLFHFQTCCIRDFKSQNFVIPFFVITFALGLCE